MRKVKADDYFNNGLFEVARFGNAVVTHNNINEDQYKEWISQIANHYDEEKEEIDNLIKKIKSNLKSKVMADSGAGFGKEQRMRVSTNRIKMDLRS